MSRKLSELIKEGCAATLPTTVTIDVDGQKIYACAMGAAYVAMVGRESVVEGFYDIDDVAKELSEEVGYNLRDKWLPHPLLQQNRDVVNIVVSLNDRSTWSREEIAAYLEENGL